jgi:hypothetical protein
VLATSTVLGLLAVCTSSVLFGLLRSVLLRVLLHVPLVHGLLRPFVGAFLRHRVGWTLLLPLRYPGVLVRAGFIAGVTAAGWEFAERAFDGAIPAVRFPLSSAFLDMV